MSLLKSHLDDRVYWLDTAEWSTPAAFVSNEGQNGGQSAETVELNTLLTQCGVIDMTHTGLVAVSGPERTSFLSGMITNQIRKVTPDHVVHAAMLSPQGHYLWDFSIAHVPGLTSEEEAQAKRMAMVGFSRNTMPKEEKPQDARAGFMLCTTPDRVDGLVDRLTMYLLRTQARLTRVNDAFGLLAVVGPQAQAALGEIFPAIAANLSNDTPVGSCFNITLEDDGEPIQLWRDPRDGDYGWRLLTPVAQLPALWDRLQEKIRPCGFNAWQRYRIEKALPCGGADLLVEKTLPLEGGYLDLHTLDFTKGCYVGQETTARTHHRGTIKKRLFSIRFTEDASAVTVGTPILLDGTKEAGIITSLALGSNNNYQGLALLRVSDVTSGQPLSAQGVTLSAHVPPWATWLI